MMKYCLSPRDFLRAQAIYHRIPRLESQYQYGFYSLLTYIAGKSRKIGILGRIYYIDIDIKGHTRPTIFAVKSVV